jgi:sec-independent protein translocase protein TatA
MGLGIPEIVIIGLAIAVLLFGGKKITELARSLGSASGEFKKAKKDVERELKAEEEKAMRAPAAQTTPTESGSDATSPKV